MTHDDIRRRLRGFMEDNFLYMRPDFKLGDDDSLMKTGVVDSMGVVEVLAFLEDELGVKVPDTDVTEANLGTINAISEYVARRRA